MKRILIHISLIAGLFVVSSCNFDEFLDDPNEVTAASTNVDFLLNNIQASFGAGFFRGTSSRGARVTRIEHQAADTYEISHQAVFQDGTWNNAYASILNDIKTLKGLAERGNFLRHLAIAQTIEAYVWMVLVDTFGDVPFSEALDPGNFNPKVDDGASVYAGALALLNQAKSNFTNISSLGAPNDFFYANNYTRWVRLVNTLLMRYHLNLRLINTAGATSAIDALIAENNFLQVGDDFVWRYGVSLQDPFSIHPSYNAQYPNGGGDYQSVFFMWHLTEAKGFDDPRAKYYFYRQTGANPTNEAEVRCINEFVPAHYPEGMPWCMPGTRGYWGRDHLDPQGIPPDGLRRTLYGVYPVGGSFDNDTPAPTSAANRGAGGAGIEPIMLAAFVDFMLAEVHLQLKDNPTAARAAMLSGAEKHINFVRSWSLGTADAARITAFQPNDAFNAQRAQYLEKIGADYDAAATTTGRMRVIAREYWISLYRSGNEAYNLYRRTGQPDNMQPGQIPNFGRFPRTFFYPNNHVNLNSNAKQKPSHDVKVFWDNNPDGFID
jgi:hypothetical protein